MAKLKPHVDPQQEHRVRIIWDRHDVYLSMRALVRGRRVHQRRIAFLDREEGILPTVPSIVERVTFVPWPRSRNALNLAQLSLSANPDDRRAAQAVVATAYAGTAVDLERDCVVYFLSAPDDDITEHLEHAIPLGDFQPTRGQANWAVEWADLEAAPSCADLKSESTDQASEMDA